jgi:hypothetical protein
VRGGWGDDGGRWWRESSSDEDDNSGEAFALISPRCAQANAHDAASAAALQRKLQPPPPATPPPSPAAAALTPGQAAASSSPACSDELELDAVTDNRRQRALSWPLCKTAGLPLGSGAQSTSTDPTGQGQGGSAQRQADAAEWERGAADAAEAERWERVGLLSHLDAVRAVAMDAKAEAEAGHGKGGTGVHRWLLSSSDDGTVKLWTVPEQPQPPTDAAAPPRDYEPLATYRGVDCLHRASDMDVHPDRWFNPRFT